MSKKLLLVMVMSMVMVFGFLATSFSQDKVIVLGYKDESKMPLIGDEKDNSGAYQELFSKAAEMIGYKLNIVRLPKKRLYKEIEAGTVDFYPGASFSEERAAYMAYLRNGFETKEVLLTRKDVKEVNDFSKLTGTMIVDLGGSKENWDKKYQNIKIHKLASPSFDQIVKMLVANRGDFYIADVEEVDYYKKSNKIKNYEDIGLKAHYSAFGGSMPMYMGFSMNSKLFKAIDNSKYDKSKPLDFENTPKTASHDCVAYKYQEALMKLKKSGETAKIYNKYFK